MVRFESDADCREVKRWLGDWYCGEEGGQTASEGCSSRALWVWRRLPMICRSFNRQLCNRRCPLPGVLNFYSIQRVAMSTSDSPRCGCFMTPNTLMASSGRPINATSILLERQPVNNLLRAKTCCRNVVIHCCHATDLVSLHVTLKPQPESCRLQLRSPYSGRG